jgi:hypothetical protein
MTAKMPNTTAQGTRSLSDSSLVSYLMLTALVGNIAAMAVGVEPSRSVATQCLCGRGFDRYLLYNGSVQLKDRYNGMKLACGIDKEVFIPARVGTMMNHPELGTADYDKILNAAYRKTLNKPNIWLSDRTRMPIWNWLYTKYGCFAFLCAIFAFLPVVLVALLSLMAGTSWVAVLVQRLIFAVLSAYDGTLLDIRREVSYVRVKKGEVSDGLHGTWDILRKDALEAHKPTASEAVRELATGKVHRLGDELLIPVLAFKPSVEWKYATWWFLLTNFRAPLLVASYSLLIDGQYFWIAAHCLALFTQACVQNGLTVMFMSEVVAYEVIWFRRLPNSKYEEEFADYTTALG